MGRFFKFLVFGSVQGVGFRPLVLREARKRGLSGFVRNAGSHAEIIADSKEAVLEIIKNLPENVGVTKADISEVDGDYSDFAVLESENNAPVFGSGIPPDTATCDNCLSELRDKGNLRHEYFFITCTSCGPRFSILESFPYDRESTSMKEFGMCGPCASEYKNAETRRFHAETIACEKCGPKISLVFRGKKVDAKNPIEEAARILSAGKIVAIKGIGGFHLACIAREDAAKKLRTLTGRPDKPFAIMARDVSMARKIAHVSADEEKILSFPARPIVLLKSKKLMPQISELDTVGVMLPYSALHNLIFDFIDEPLIMTSSNMPDEPITSQAREQFADYVLAHDRQIVNRIDDSVVKPVSGKTLLIRRSRGFVPLAINVGVGEPILALGGDSMNTFCLARGGKAIMSQHIGNLASPATFARYKGEILKFLRMYNFRPAKIACDMHPQYYSSKFAGELSEKFSAELVRVQHHAAHAASCAAEHNLEDYVGIICDGAGYGTDGTMWGGEILLDGARAGNLEPQTLIGGDSSVMRPEKMLFGILRKFLQPEEISRAAQIPLNECAVLDKQISLSFNCVQTTSAGRVLDAASALLGFCKNRTYDGRPAMRLEAISASAKPFDFSPKIKGNVLLTTPLFECFVENSGKDKSRLAATAQQYLAEGLYKIASSHKKPVVFSGGCAYNRIMAEYMLSKGAFINEKVPAGDGGLSFGQIAHISNKY